MTRSLLLILTGSFLLAASGLATAATVTVDSGTDPIDINWQTATIADLPGPDGRISFSEAMIATNNTRGARHHRLRHPAERLDDAVAVSRPRRRPVVLHLLLARLRRR